MNDFVTSAHTRLYYGDSGTTAAASITTALAGIKNFPTLPKNEVDEFETTRIDQMDGSDHDWYKQFQPDHIDPGTLNAKLAFIPDNVETVYGLIRTSKAWKILFPNQDTLVFEGWLKTVGPEQEDRGEVVVDVVIRLLGKPVYAKYVAG